MKRILIFGAGKSSTCLIEYLGKFLQSNNWLLTVADADLVQAQTKLGGIANTEAITADVTDSIQRKNLIQSAEIVISLLPPALHYLVAIECLASKKNLLTASYIDDNIKSLSKQIADSQLLFLCEMGLDPGIDHMSAVKLIHQIRSLGGSIHSFKSHCGGLVSPQSDDNPWHYKISWNPRNIVLAGKAGAHSKENGQIKHYRYEDLFDANRVVEVPELGYLAWYPNRDSLSYARLYDTEDAHTFVRTTLRDPEFCFGWKNIIDLKLTDETVQYDTDGMTLQQFFQLHFNQNGFSDWIEKQLTARFAQTKSLLEKLQELLAAEEEVDEAKKSELQDFMMVDNAGELMDINIDEVKNKAAATVAGQMHEANLSLKQLFFLGMDDDSTFINKGRCSAADVLQFSLEQKLRLKADDKDMIVMMHELEYSVDGKSHFVNSSLIVQGEDNLRTAMAKTVGLPLGIATRLILEGKIKLTGLHIPILPEIYNPVMKELEEYDIRFQESNAIS
ncbi:MAG: saccharopine dehydrogenase NADP-binding domain-containing protein [Chitinophagaceae bacterium]|nr:saccharopine dehydrogenase NADP-binding domain-containing protein [Chitinophagaceae bacterium]